MKFDVDFEEQILAQCLKDKSYLQCAQGLLKSHHFSTHQHSWIWDAIQENWTKNAELLAPKLLLSIANRKYPDSSERKPILQLAAKIFKLDPEAPQSSLNELSQFTRYVTLQSAFEVGLKHIEKGDITKAWDVIKASTAKDFDRKQYDIVSWIEEFEKRLQDAKERRDNPDKFPFIKTGFKKLDGVIDGIQSGQLGLVIATTGMGKSITLNHLGYHGILQNYNVLHVSLEMGVQLVAMRYDSRFTGVLHKKFKLFGFDKDDLELIEAKLKKNKERFSNKLKIVSMPVRTCNLNNLRTLLEDVRQSGFEPDLMIVDSADHMVGIGRFESTRLEHAQIYWGLKGLAEEESLPIWTSTQAGKEWEEKTIHRTGAASESYDKERICDIGISLNDIPATSRASKVTVVKEGEDETVDAVEESEVQIESALGKFMEMVLVKYRDGESRIKIPVEAEFSRMLIKDAEIDK